MLYLQAQLLPLSLIVFLPPDFKKKNLITFALSNQLIMMLKALMIVRLSTRRLMVRSVIKLSCDCHVTIR